MNTHILINKNLGLLKTTSKVLVHKTLKQDLREHRVFNIASLLTTPNDENGLVGRDVDKMHHYKDDNGTSINYDNTVKAVSTWF